MSSDNQDIVVEPAGKKGKVGENGAMDLDVGQAALEGLSGNGGKPPVVQVLFNEKQPAEATGPQDLDPARADKERREAEAMAMVETARGEKELAARAKREADAEQERKLHEELAAAETAAQIAAEAAAKAAQVALEEQKRLHAQQQEEARAAAKELSEHLKARDEAFAAADERQSPDAETAYLEASKELQRMATGRSKLSPLAQDLWKVLETVAPGASSLSYRKALAGGSVAGLHQSLEVSKMYVAEFLGGELPESAESWSKDAQQVEALVAIVSLKTPDAVGVPPIQAPLELLLSDGSRTLTRSMPLFIVADGLLLLRFPSFVSRVLPEYLAYAIKHLEPLGRNLADKVPSSGQHPQQTPSALVISPPRDLRGPSSAAGSSRGASGEVRELLDSRDWRPLFQPDLSLLGESYQIQLGGNQPSALRAHIRDYLQKIPGLPRHVLVRVPSEDDEGAESVYPLFFLAFPSDAPCLAAAECFKNLGPAAPDWNFRSTMQTGSNVNSRELKLSQKVVDQLGGPDEVKLAIETACEMRGAPRAKVVAIKRRAGKGQGGPGNGGEKEGTTAFSVVWPNQEELDKCVGNLRIDGQRGRSATVRVVRQGAMMAELGQLEFATTDYSAIWALGEEKIVEALAAHLDPVSAEIKVYQMSNDSVVCVSMIPTSAALMLARFTPSIWIAGAFRRVRSTFGINSAGIAGQDYDAIMKSMIPGPDVYVMGGDDVQVMYNKGKNANKKK